MSRCFVPFAFVTQAVRHSTPEFGDWKMHWITQGSHCDDDYPDKVLLLTLSPPSSSHPTSLGQCASLNSSYPPQECPYSRGLRVLNASDYLLYNLAFSVDETRNYSVAAHTEVVAKLTALKRAHEADPTIFGPSQV